MAKNISNLQRKEIPYFEGVNRLVAANLSKKTELSHAENARSTTIGTIEKRRGTSMLGNDMDATANYKIFYFENSTTPGFYRVSTVGGVTSIYYLNSLATWTILSGTGLGTGIDVVANKLFSIITAEKCCFLVNGDDANRYIESDGTTVKDAASSYLTNHLYNTPPARKVNYYKGKLHLADYTVGGTRYQNSVMISSEPLGIVSLVNLDYATADCGADDWIEVTDTKYIYNTDTLDIYRGNAKIADITVKDKTESKIQINTITFAGSFTTLEASDEIWVDGTYNGTRIFRWAGNPASGTDVKQYDTFTLSGGQNNRIKMFTNINDYEIIANSSNMTYWNGSTLKNLDIGIGCVSDNGYAKAAGAIWFIHYTGIYVTTGYEIPKLMSAPVQQYFDGATKAGLDGSAIGVKGTSIFFAIGDVTLYNPDGSVDQNLSNVVLERNLRQETWYPHTNLTATEFATYNMTDTVDRLEFASTDTGYHIMELLNGETDDSTILQKEILFRVDTNDVVLCSDFEKFGYPQTLIVETERGSGLDAFISLDGEPFYQIRGKVNKGCSVIPINGRNTDDSSPPRCRSLRISIRDFSKSICKISRIAILYAETLESEEQTN